jgi:predicted ATPase
VNRYILTGAPGSGKTAVLRMLETAGYLVVEEAATHVIALAQAEGEDEPWRQPSFIDRIVALQRQRQLQLSTAEAPIQFYDRSPICTLALNRYLHNPPNTSLAVEVERVAREGIYRPEVFFLRNLGFIEPTAARRITFEETLAFERVHEEVYRECGFTLIDIPKATLASRTGWIEGLVTPKAT